MADPRPVTDGLFVETVDGARLRAGRCAACGELHFPAGSTCPYCAAPNCVEVCVGPAARLRLFTTVRSAPPGYRGSVPYGFGVVELSEGLCIITRLTEVRAEYLRPGLPMRLVVERLHTDDDGRDVLSYAFRPEEA